MSAKVKKTQQSKLIQTLAGPQTFENKVNYLTVPNVYGMNK